MSFEKFQFYLSSTLVRQRADASLSAERSVCVCVCVCVCEREREMERGNVLTPRSGLREGFVCVCMCVRVRVFECVYERETEREEM